MLPLSILLNALMPHIAHFRCMGSELIFLLRTQSREAASLAARRSLSNFSRSYIALIDDGFTRTTRASFAGWLFTMMRDAADTD